MSFGMFCRFALCASDLFLMHLHHPVPSIIVAYLLCPDFEG